MKTIIPCLNCDKLIKDSSDKCICAVNSSCFWNDLMGVEETSKGEKICSEYTKE